MPAPPRAAESTDLIWRLRRVLSAVDLDCQCRTSLEGVLNRFTSLEHRRLMRKALAETREHKDQIIARLAFLAELDEITERETDRTVFEEMAILFDEIGAAAQEAARSVRSIGSLQRPESLADPVPLPARRPTVTLAPEQRQDAGDQPMSPRSPQR